MYEEQYENLMVDMKAITKIRKDWFKLSLNASYDRRDLPLFSMVNSSCLDDEKW